MPISEEDQRSLQRFGCALHTRPELLHFNWMGLTREQALGATVLVRTTHRQCASGPALCFALEISPMRILPRYCYFSFDLLNPWQMGYLAELSDTNVLSINFLGHDFELVGQHELTPSESDELKKSQLKAKDALITNAVPYSVAKITDELASNLRIPQLFERVISENDFAKALPQIWKDSEKIPPAKRALARKLVGEFADSLRSRYGEQLKKGMGDIPQMRLGLVLLLDLQRIFGNDYDSFVAFIGDAVAFNADEELLATLRKWAANLEAIFKLIELANSLPQAKRGKALRDLGQAVISVLKLIGKGRELSMSMLHTLLRPLKPLLSGQPGRPTKDYSREYELKKSGLSWTKVARRSLIDNEDIREEFGGRTFAALTFEQQQGLVNRIREGVRSHAERAGKPFPIESVPTMDDPQEIE
jgi:hypothetical protein